MGIENMPINNVEWKNRDDLHANNYNPNHVAPPELRLLKISIMEDGWTQPIVIRPDGEIVDGFHRWLVSDDPEVRELTGGNVPVVVLDVKSGDHQMMSTIRHNRARGSHGVLPMAEIVRRLIDDEGMSRKGVMNLLQMEDEEVERLYDRGGMVKRGRAEDFGNSWVPDL